MVLGLVVPPGGDASQMVVPQEVVSGGDGAGGGGGRAPVRRCSALMETPAGRRTISSRVPLVVVPQDDDTPHVLVF